MTWNHRIDAVTTVNAEPAESAEPSLIRKAVDYTFYTVFCQPLYVEVDQRFLRCSLELSSRAPKTVPGPFLDSLPIRPQFRD
jgi:hypothetical protein